MGGVNSVPRGTAGISGYSGDLSIGETGQIGGPVLLHSKKTQDLFKGSS
jgi:hypothetical protein